MHIHFGLNLDGERGRSARNQLGFMTAGPLGMLNVLETQMGLLRDRPSQSQRIVQYRDCLKRADHERRFYHLTFATDELGTASVLLGWRDLWFLHGWTGIFPDSASDRLKDLAQVEILAKDTVSPCVGERLAEIIDAMSRRKPIIDRIDLEEPLEWMPRQWQSVFKTLPTEVISNKTTGNDGFLGQLQSALVRIDLKKPEEKLRWQDDGTLKVVRAETSLLAAGWVAKQVKASKGTTLLVGGPHSSLLDDMLASDDRPRQGLSEASAFRPTLQVLPLVLELMWAPLNFHALLQFLTHSVCPVPNYARYRLAAVLADKPGIGSDSWNATLESIDKHYAERSAGARKSIATWVTCDRHPQSTGVPVQEVLDRVRLLQDFFRLRLSDSDPARGAAFYAGFAQAHACSSALEGLLQQNVLFLLPVQLQKLVSQATARGSENPLVHAEVGACLSISNPGAAIESVDRVLWWQLAMPTVAPSYPWSRTELEQLEIAGIQLPTVADQLQREAVNWIKPILKAKQQLILALPPKGEEVHPVWLMLESLADGIPIEVLDDVLASPASEVTSQVAHVPLPTIKRWWDLTAVKPLERKYRDSFSSLELFIFNPYQWVLKYPAGLKTSRILSVSENFRLFGNIAHGVIEQFYCQENALQMNSQEAMVWFDLNFDQTVEKEGATLLMPGHLSDLADLRIKLRRAFVQLQFQMAAAGVTRVEPELELSGGYAGGELAGYADLVVTRGDGTKAIVDMKWAGKKFEDQLKSNTHLQLAIYGELLRQKDYAWPKLGFYMIANAQLLATDADFFPNARLVRKANDETTAQLWLQFAQTWKWRRMQLDSGLVEVALDGVETTAESVFPSDGLTAQYLNTAYNDFLHLAGWGN